jgi:hypothetical protein
MTDLLLRSTNVFRSFSSSSKSSSSTPAAVSVTSEDSDISSLGGEQEEIDDNSDLDVETIPTEEMNFLASLASSSMPHQPVSSSSSSSCKSKQQYHHQQQSPFDIEEATPPVSSQRLDPSRRRNGNTNTVCPMGGDDQQQMQLHSHSHHQQQLQLDDEINDIILPKPPSSMNRVSGLPLTLNQQQLGTASTNTPPKKAAEPRLIHP